MSGTGFRRMVSISCSRDIHLAFHCYFLICEMRIKKPASEDGVKEQIKILPLKDVHNKGLLG